MPASGGRINGFDRTHDHTPAATSDDPGRRSSDDDTVARGMFGPGSVTGLATKHPADRNTILTGSNGSQRNLSDTAETVHRQEHLRPADARQRGEVFHRSRSPSPQREEHFAIDRL